MKITIIQRNYIVADFAYNFNKIKQAIIEHRSSDLIVSSELSVIGYYPYDLLLCDSFIHKQNQVIAEITQLTKVYNTAVVIGVARAISGIKKYYNAALVIDRGTLIFEYHKQLIPSYGVFDEARHFVAGKTSPFFNFKGCKMALFICEDIWFNNHQGHKINPVKALVSSAVDCVISIHASPSILGKFEQRLKMVASITQYTQAPVVYCSQVGGFDELVYDGTSFVTNKKGEVVALAPSFKEGEITVDIHQLPSQNIAYPISNRYQLIVQHLMLGLKDYVVKCGFHGVVVGASGGIDSALTLVIATLALGANNVTAITMPSIYSSQGSVDDSVKLCHNLGIVLLKRDIQGEVNLACQNFQQYFGAKPKNVTQENIQARIRGRIVMEYANDKELLMLTTGNKSELAVGYATLYGDMCGALNCIGDLYKSEVYALSNYINQHYGNIIPKEILQKAPSAELAHNQKDTDSLPDYHVLDPMLKLYLEKDMLYPDEISKLESIVDHIDHKQRERVYAMIKQSEFKRKQAPPILFVQRKSFGMGRRVPVTANFVNQSALVH